MRDVSFKPTTKRTATARAELFATGETIARVKVGDTPKGDPIPVAKVAAIQATKKTTEWIPYCHNIPIEHVDVAFEFESDRIVVSVYVVSVAKTGVEMEAVTAAGAAVITLYDMLKMIDDDMYIGSIRLLEKTGGKSDLASLADWSARVIVSSDRASRGEYTDLSGEVLTSGLQSHGAAQVTKVVVSDDLDLLRKQVSIGVAEGADIIIVTGGTGVGPRDVSFEAVSELIQVPLPGVVSAFMKYSQDRMPTAMLARPMAGIVQESVILAIPGSPGACRDLLHSVFPSILHVLSMIKGEGHP